MRILNHFLPKYFTEGKDYAQNIFYFLLGSFTLFICSQNDDLSAAEKGEREKPGHGRLNFERNASASQQTQAELVQHGSLNPE